MNPDRKAELIRTYREGLLNDTLPFWTRHAIEGAWFIMLEGQHRGDDTLVRTGCQMLDWMWARGWDQEYGGMP